MTAKEARQLSDLNKPKEEDITLTFILEIEKQIKLDCNNGGNMIFVSPNKINSKAIQHFTTNGFTVQLKEVQTLMDKYNYQITW